MSSWYFPPIFLPPLTCSCHPPNTYPRTANQLPLWWKVRFAHAIVHCPYDDPMRTVPTEIAKPLTGCWSGYRL
ncbi:hypothetical protein KCP78_21580 [Salmonella enterica subsp. enterica]|nr:hypothetical protein KCP78_21580 [Salmonella enterica subsp. enterica]